MYIPLRFHLLPLRKKFAGVNMSLLKINGEEIVPVRMINFVSVKHIRPQRLAAILAYIQRPDGFQFTPYRVQVQVDDEIVTTLSTL
jgi:hypothetical protein